MRKIIFISKVPISSFPRLFGIPLSLSNLGYSVIIIAPGELPEILENKNKILFEKINIADFNIRYLRKIFLWFSFRISVIKKLQNYKEDNVLWLSSADSAIPLFGFINTYEFILQINELYDKVPFYKFMLKRISKYARSVVVPEINRAFIIKVWFNLKNVPHVLPNKPNYLLLESPSLTIDEKNRIDEINIFIGERKMILYLGIIANDRKFEGVVNFVKESQDYCLVLIGKDLGYLKEINNDSEKILYGGYFTPPAHLEIVKSAHICLMAYDTTSLNNIYCAPNKIWEYTLYNKPILSQTLPVIEAIFDKYKIGVCCDLNILSEVKIAINEIDDSYNVLQNNTEIFFNSINIESDIKSIIHSNI